MHLCIKFDLPDMFFKGGGRLIPNPLCEMLEPAGILAPFWHLQNATFQKSLYVPVSIALIHFSLVTAVCEGSELTEQSEQVYNQKIIV